MHRDNSTNDESQAASVEDEQLSRYYYLKIGPGNSLAPPLLAEERLGHPVVAGFFRDVRLPEIRDHNPEQRPRFSRQAIDLYNWAEGELPGYAINLAYGVCRVLEPTGGMYEMERDLFEKTVGPTPHKDDIPKLVPVRIAFEERITHIPTLLSQINGNRRLSSSTFKEITDDFGYLLAIDYVLFKGGLLNRYRRFAKETRTVENLLRCLGGNELIDLVARVLEEQGLYVPAPTGGFVKNVDIFAYNDKPFEKDLAGVVVTPRRAFRSGAITVQVRGIAADTRPERSPGVDYFLQLNADDDLEDDHILNHTWLDTMLRRSPRTRWWINRVLRWVPFAGAVIAEIDRSVAVSDQPPAP